MSGEIKERAFDVRVLFIRHGQSANNVLAETHGHDYAAYMAGRVYEPPLSEIGQRQAKLLAEKMAARTATPIPPSLRLGWVTTEYPVARLYVSPMLRAMQTALPISRALGLVPEAANPEANARIAASILASFPGELADSTGMFGSLWLARLSAVASDAQGMIDELLDEAGAGKQAGKHEKNGP